MVTGKAAFKASFLVFFCINKSAHLRRRLAAITPIPFNLILLILTEEAESGQTSLSDRILIAVFQNDIVGAALHYAGS